MKKFLSVALLLIPVLGFSQIQWQDNGIPIRKAENIRWFGDSVELNDGSVVVLWRGTREDNYQIFAQRINEAGNTLWEDGGINISYSQSLVYSFVATSSSDGNFFVAWFQSDDSYDEGYLTIQKINPAGEPCWTTAGVSINISDFENKMYLNSDDNGGVYLLWEEYYDLKGIRFDSDGLLAAGWDATGNILLSYSISNYLMYVNCSNLNGNLIFTYSIENGDNIDVYIQKVDPNAILLWGTAGNLIVSNELLKSYLKILTNSNGFWIGWWEQSPDFDINIYRFNEDGSQYWTQPLEIGLQDTYIYGFQLVSDTNNYLYSGWYDEIEMNYHIAKIDENQNMLWGNEGITAFSFDNDDEKYYAIQTTPDNEVNFVCVYAADYYDHYLYFDQFDASGASVLSEPLELNHITGRICYSSIDVQNNSNSFIAWGEFDYGNDKLKYQIVNNQNQPILTPTGETLFSGRSGTCSYLKTISMNNKSAVFWSIYNNTFLQTVNNEGSTLSENGIQINGDEHILYGDYSIGYDESNQRILSAWNHENEGLGAISVQAVNEDGNLLWGENGVSATNSELEQYNPQISALDGNAYVGWTEHNGDWLNPEAYLYANKINNSGDLCWGENGLFLYESTGYSGFSEILGRFFIWEDDLFPGNSIFAILLDENGNPEPGWEEGGKLISTQEGTNITSTCCEVPDGYFISWRALQGDDTNIYGQIVLENGEILWEENGIQLAELVNSSTNRELNIFYGDAFYLDWYEYNNSMEQFEIHLNKFGWDGNPIWPDNGIVVAAGERRNFMIINDNIIVVYDYYNDDDYNIGAKLFSTDGEELWNAILCDKPHDQRNPVLSKSGDNNIVISWLDNRDGIYSYGEISSEYTEVYAQNVYVEPTSTPDEILNAITAVLHQNYPNPFNPSTTISFQLNTETTENTELVIYNLKGQKVKTFPVILSGVEGSGNNNYSVVWDGTDQTDKPVGTGIYFCKLKVDGKDKLIRKMMLIK
ncbi:MAG: T9SS type A sorting domain-containing protein [Candidatus Cloacimonadales bacterium]|nr:T9SS type A sorting domain-containing protein [Candidatus Cloacimonadales bacterium]